jgi:subtilase family serine protease
MAEAALGLKWEAAMRIDQMLGHMQWQARGVRGLWTAALVTLGSLPLLVIGLGAPGVAGVAAAAGASGAYMQVVGSASSRPPGATDLGPADPSQPLVLDIVLRPRDPAALAAAVTAVSTPGSSDYRHYLAKGQFDSLYGPTASMVTAVRSSLTNSGLRVGSLTDGLFLPVSTTVHQAEGALEVKIESFRLASGREGLANMTAPRVSSSIAGDIESVVGLNTLFQSAPDGAAAPSPEHAVPSPGTTTTAPGQPVACSAGSKTPSGYSRAGFTATDIAESYDVDPLYDVADFGAGQTIGLVEYSTYSPSDVATYQTCYGTSVPIAEETITGSEPPVETSWLEADSDIEDVAGLAPGIHVRVYEAYNSSTNVVPMYAQIASDDSANVVSTSWAICEPIAEEAGVTAGEEVAFAQMALQGQSMYASSGDNGSEACVPWGYTNLAVDDPASQPYVTGVGGTDLPTTVSSTPKETAWSDSGGGISTLWSMPAYQQGTGVLNSFSSASPCLGAAAPGTPYATSPSGDCRQVPDVSADADPSPGYQMYSVDPDTGVTGWLPVGGTSLATPTWAAITALINEWGTGCATSDVGFANPSLYQVASSTPQDLRDITSGNNDPDTKAKDPTYPATTGYDMVTGLGAPIAGNLAQSLCARDVTTVSTALSASSVKPSTSVKDAATLHDPYVSTATGTVTYTVYSDDTCTTSAASAGTEKVGKDGVVPDSKSVSLKTPGVYYWQASYSGSLNGGETTLSPCGSEVEDVQGATTLTGTLSSSTTTAESPVTDTAVLAGPEASTAGGTVTYTVYSTASCTSTKAVASGGEVAVTDGAVPSSSGVSLPAGTYYWEASYSGDALNEKSVSKCSAGKETVSAS